jgi:hypothetical protein
MDEGKRRCHVCDGTGIEGIERGGDGDGCEACGNSGWVDALAPTAFGAAVSSFYAQNSDAVASVFWIDGRCVIPDGSPLRVPDDELRSTLVEVMHNTDVSDMPVAITQMLEDNGWQVVKAARS